jgi:hypothetical protein
MERWNKESKTYVLEGPLDSLFLPNAIATGGGNLVTDLGDHKENIVVCYDNEPKSETTVDKMRRAIAHDFAVCIWPKELKHKDINKMVLAGIAPAKIENIINSNTFTGLEAEVRLNLWSVS